MISEEKFLSYAKLKLHIDLPSVEETWLDGYESAKSNLDESKNPFPQGTTEYFHWQEGWWSGFYGEDPLFSLAGEVNSTAFRHDLTSVRLPSIESLVKNVWKNIQNHHWYIRAWHVMASAVGYLIIFELMDLLVYAE